MTLQQYKLVAGNQNIVAWLEAGRAKVGDRVTLKDNDDDQLQWTVAEAYSSINSDVLNDAHSSGKVFGSIQGRG